MKVPNYSYLFLFLSILSFNVLAGADPDEVTLEEEMQIENATQKKDYVQKDNIELKIENELLRLSIFNHKYNEEFDKGFFKLINPKFLN